MKFILIMTLFFGDRSGASITIAEFESKALCELAGAAWNEQAILQRGWIHHSYICTPKESAP